MLHQKLLTEANCFCKKWRYITIDASQNTINLKISDEEFATRKANWVQPESNIKKEFTKIYQISF
jgi:dihydroxyacid dehydratase/phosphogluconate dehydratase